MKTLLTSLLLLALLSKAAAGNDPARLYADIARSISSVSGNIDLNFTQGSWTKTLGTKKVIVEFSQNQRASMKFAYVGGRLQDGSVIKFDPGIHIWLKSASGGLSLRIDEIRYDDYGKFKDWKVKYDNPDAIDPNQIAGIQDALRLKDKSEDLFSITLFKNITDAKQSDRNGNVLPGLNKRPMLTSIMIRKPNEAEPGLAVSFIPNSVLHFSSKTSSSSYDNTISLNTGNFEFRYLEYNVQQKSVDCEISQFDLDLRSGMLQTTDMLINIGLGSKLNFSRLKIRSDENGKEVNGENGVMQVQVSSGTKFGLGNTGKYKNEIVFNNGEMNLFDFVYLSSSDNKNSFSIGGGSSIKVSTRSGSLSLFEDKGYLSLASGMLEANLFGTWGSQNKTPDAHLNISLFQVSLDGGLLPISKNNVIGISSGTIKSESLRFDAMTFAGLTGEFKDLNIVLNDETRFAIPGGMEIDIKEGSVIDGAEPNNPLKLDVKNNYVTGLFRFNLNFSAIRNAPSKVLSLHEGAAKFKARMLSLDTIKVSDMHLSGAGDIVAENAKFNWLVEFSEGAILSVRGREPELRAKIRMKLAQAVPLDVVTPYFRIDDRSVAFPLKLSVSLLDAVESNEVLIWFNGQDITMDQLTLSPKFQLVVKEGLGEHENPDDPQSANGSEGPDEFHNWQEAVFYDCPNPVGVMHFYLAPQTYTINSTMNLSIKGKTIDFNFGNLNMDGPITWKKDGCDLADWIGFIGSLAGAITGGSGGALVGAIVGVNVGDSLEDKLKSFVNAGIARKTTQFSLNKQWTFQ
jgi:hypothetical protein